MRTEQVKGTDAIPADMAKADDVGAVDCHQEDIAVTQRAPPSQCAFVRFERVCLRPQPHGVGVPIGLHMDPCDRRNIVKHSFTDLEHLSLRLVTFRSVQAYSIGK